MTRTGAALVIASALAACSAEDNACPAGTLEVIDSEIARNRLRTCERLDSPRKHGPALLIDPEGKRRRIGQYVEGMMHGSWQYYYGQRHIGESVWDHGQLLSRNEWGVTFVPYHRSTWVRGVAHGPFLIRTHRPVVMLVGEHTHGRRRGSWRESGGRNATWSYDAHGVMTTFDGKPVPPPLDEIELADGKVLRRTSCGLAKARLMETGDLESPCHDLFEAFQRCAVAPDPEPCRARSLAAYAKKP